MKKPHQKAISQTPFAQYGGLIGGIAGLLEAARRTAARTINALMTATYWEIGRRIVEFEQGGEKRAEYGEGLLARLADDLTAVSADRTCRDSVYSIFRNLPKRFARHCRAN